MADLFHKHMTQRVPSDPHWAVNCTAYCGAMLINDATLGAASVTGRIVRAKSNEPNPQAGSPGLNILQIIGVARASFGVKIIDCTGRTWPEVEHFVSAGRRVLLQIDYGELPEGDKCQAGGDFGHAVVLVRYTPDGKLRASDPLCSTTKSYDPEHLQVAARKFARDTGVNDGLRWAATRVVPQTTVPWENHPF